MPHSSSLSGDLAAIAAHELGCAQQLLVGHIVEEGAGDESWHAARWAGGTLAPAGEGGTQRLQLCWPRRSISIGPKV